MSGAPLKVELEKDGALLRLRLSRPKANIVDAAMIAALRVALREHLPGVRLRAVLLEAEGPHFSFGASVEEHLPGSAAAMLRELHALILTLVASTAPVLVAVRGQCLGGGLELAAAGHLIFAAPGATLGQPEIKLAVFAPAASCLLPERIGPSRAADLLFSGRSIGAEEAHRIGLVDALADDPSHAALAYFEEHLAPRSPSSLRIAVHAARFDFVARVRRKLAKVERLYLKELMATHDALEGLSAFVEKRPPVWEER
ncbi:MAG: bamR [Deltaproteobacteria bacterium]|nr:bamR [Deltaproteobacteria bacterium]